MFENLFQLKHNQIDRPAIAARSSSHPSTVFSQPPQRVVRAERDYHPRQANEIAFMTGDFFYVISSSLTHYEVINPDTKQHGSVPLSCFQSLGKSSSTPPIARYAQQTNHSRKSEAVAKTAYKNSYIQHGTSDCVIESIQVPLVECRENSYYFTIKAKLANGLTRIIHRTSSELWTLHISLLTHFPAESGRNLGPRIIPFMSPPTKDLNLIMTQKHRHDIDTYLQLLISLPLYILESLQLTRFLQLKDRDIETHLEVDFEGSALILDLISDYLEDFVTLKVTVAKGDVIKTWNISESITYKELIEQVKIRFGNSVLELAFEDECLEQISLFGDADLKLLIKSGADMKLYVGDKLL